MNIICPNCGASANIEKGQNTCECLYCGTKLSPDSHAYGQSVSKNNNLSSLIELAETAYRGKDYKGLKKYIDLALELNVQNSKLWWYKALAEAKQIINVRNRISWIFECGEKSIEYAEDKESAAADMCLVYIELAIDKLNFVRQWPQTDFLDEPDSDVLDYEKDIITLYRKVPKETIRSNTNVKEKMILLSQCWLRHINRHPGSMARVRYLKSIYNEISPLSESEKKEELKLFGEEILESHRESEKDQEPKNSCLGCVMLISVIIAIFGWLNTLLF